MRLALYLLFSLFLSVLGRRGSTPPATSQKRSVLQKRGYPYGWGIRAVPLEGEPAEMNHVDDAQDKVKPVKNGKLHASYE
jgi:hypothetical protein